MRICTKMFFDLDILMSLECHFYFWAWDNAPSETSDLISFLQLLSSYNEKWFIVQFSNAMSSLGVNFVNVKHTHFLYQRLFSSYVLALNKLSYEKIASLTLMKLTAGFLLMLFEHKVTYKQRIWIQSCQSLKPFWWHF